MEDDIIIVLLERALNRLLRVDSWLLTHDLNEPCITHQIAHHLTQRFNEYHVDCEYNGDIHREGNRKKIHYIEEHLRELYEENPIGTAEIREVSVFPDIIIHRRGSNDHNLCIIEVKKTTNRRGFDFDRIKLQAYTSDNYGNNLNFQLGVFVILNTNDVPPSYTFELYKEGARVNNN